MDQNYTLEQIDPIDMQSTLLNNKRIHSSQALMEYSPEELTGHKQTLPNSSRLKSCQVSFLTIMAGE